MAEDMKNQMDEENLPQAESMQKKNKTLRILLVVFAVVMIIGAFGDAFGDALGDIGALLGIIISVIVLTIFGKNRAKN